ncbi:MAG: electron transport complex subunit RsxC [Nanoarchaeota archaeon]
MFGVHPKDNKVTRRKKVIKLPLPKKVIIPLSQHIGAPNEPIVKVGDIVKTGQVIGKNDAFVSSYVHASISGKVVEIAPYYTPLGIKIPSVVIESDGKDEWIEKESLSELSNKELISKLKEFGLVGLGGATFPTHVKLSPPPGKKVEIIIVNGAECEPYLSCDNRLMIEKGNSVLAGLNKVLELTDSKKAYIGIEENKPNSIRNLKKLIKKNYSDKQIEVVSLKKLYPQGAEKVLINTITGQWVKPGGLPIDLGIVVLNVGTLNAINQALIQSKPVIERTLTIAGDIKEPNNLLVRIGTPFKDIIDFCGGYIKKPKKIIAGGPMMGIAQFSDEISTMKGTSGILIFNSIKKNDYLEKPCTKCGKCVDVCPMNLAPLFISRNSRLGNYEDCKRYNVMDCFECGSCAFTCPSKIPLVQLIKDAKYKVKIKNL